MEGIALGASNCAERKTEKDSDFRAALDRDNEEAWLDQRRGM